MKTHPCKAKGCKRIVAHDRLMCIRHWRMVPRPVQLDVWSAYRRGPLSRDHVAAMDAAIAAVAAFEATLPQPRLIP